MARKEVGIAVLWWRSDSAATSGSLRMAYLTQWRLQLVAHTLPSTSHSVAQVASGVGYELQGRLQSRFQAGLRTATCAFPHSVEDPNRKVAGHPRRPQPLDKDR